MLCSKGGAKSCHRVLLRMASRLPSKIVGFGQLICIHHWSAHGRQLVVLSSLPLRGRWSL